MSITVDSYPEQESYWEALANARARQRVIPQDAKSLYREAYRWQRVFHGNGTRLPDNWHYHTELMLMIGDASWHNYHARNRRDQVSIATRFHWRMELSLIPGHVKYCVKQTYASGFNSFYRQLANCQE